MSEKVVQRLFAFVAILALVFGTGGTGQVSAQDALPRIPFPATEMPHQPVDLSNVATLMEKGGTAKVVVVLEQPSLIALAVQARENGLQVAPADAQAQLSSIQQAQNALQAQLESPQIGGTTLFKNQRVYNGIAIRVDASKLPAIAALPGIAAVYPLETHYVDNAYAADLIGAKDVWNSLSDVGSSFTGRGISIAIIDTGVDFLHKNFGGPANYEEAAAATGDFTTEDADVFPTEKVVGGYDFAGDDYDANDPALDTPNPDPIPMDCNGHGSHVAGSAAGFGVNQDGSTYTGQYSASLDTLEMRIGPGMAPEASLYALRVFGCEGSTNLTDMAVEWAVDPNGDGDLSDHVDVINMSLGSGFGSQESSSSIAAEAAVMAGVIVVASSGNAGDTSYITGSPAVATRAINVAATVDAYTVMDGFTVNSPDTIDGVYGALAAVNWPVSTVPEVTGDLKYPTDLPNNVNGCSAFPAGYFNNKIALLDWTLPQVCGSAARSLNATNAGAKGVLMIYEAPVLDITIAGSSVVPSMITTQAVGKVLKTAIAAGQTVNVTLNTDLNASIQVLDETTNDLVATFTSRGPRTGDVGLKPDIAAPGMTIFSTASGRFLGAEGIEYGSGEDGVTFNGTSMAAPIVAGSMAILREQHPDWTAEELKALVMNTATSDIYSIPGQTGQIFSPVRVGAGRIDVENAVRNTVIAYNDAVPGAVSVSFGDVEVTDVYSESVHVAVENKGDNDVAYNLAYRAVTDNPGVEFTLLDMNDTAITSLTVRAGTTERFKVRLTATAANLRNVRDLALETSQGTVFGSFERIWLSDEAGLIEMTGTGLPNLRLPVHVAAVPVSNMRANRPMPTIPNNATGTVNVNLGGTGVDTSGGAFNGYPENITSLVSIFELAAVSERLPISSRLEQMADLQAIGVTTDYPVFRDDANNATGMNDAAVFFGIATYGEWNTPAELQFEVYIDVDQDGTEDYVLYSFPLPTAGGDPTDVLVTILYDFEADENILQDYINLDNGTGPGKALLNNNVMVLPAYAESLGLTAEDGAFDYLVAAWSAQTGALVDFTDWLTFDAANPVLDLNNNVPGMPTYADLPGAWIPVVYDRTGENAEKDFQGLLLLHHHNAEGTRVDILRLMNNIVFFPMLSK